MSRPERSPKRRQGVGDKAGFPQRPTFVIDSPKSLRSFQTRQRKTCHHSGPLPQHARLRPTTLNRQIPAGSYVATEHSTPSPATEAVVSAAGVPRDQRASRKPGPHRVGCPTAPTALQHLASPPAPPLPPDLGALPAPPRPSGAILARRTARGAILHPLAHMAPAPARARRGRRRGLRGGQPGLRVRARP